MSADGGFEFATVPSPEELARFPLNDLGNAWRLIRTVGGRILDDGTIDARHARLLYLRNRGWIAFNGRHWDLAAGEEWARRFAHQVASGLVAQGRIVAEEQIASPSVWAKFVQGAGSSGASGAMLAQAQAYLSVDLKEFDNHPLWINCQNGVLKFEAAKTPARSPGGESPPPDGAGKPRFTFQKVHEPADRITRICEAVYDPKAERPLFDKLAADAQPNPELRGFLQAVFGYAATGATNEQVFVILQGKGGDGKSTLVNAVRDVLGAYACSAGIEMFLDAGVRRGGEASPEVARLSGDTRLISTGEPPRGAKLATSAVKAFTGGGSVAARELRQSIFEFQPIGKVVLECNSRPAINDTDDGIWRRLLIILFEHQVPVASRDKDLPDKLKAEKSGILNWLVDGVLAWLVGGLVAPAAVRQAIEDYRLGGNPFGEWFADRLDRSDPTCRTRAGELYTDYKAFCDENGHDRPMSTTAFGRALGDMQIILAGKDSSGKKLRRGAKLKPKYAPEELEDPFARPGAGAATRSSPGGVRGSGALEPPPETAFDADVEGDFGPASPDDDFGGAVMNAIAPARPALRYLGGKWKLAPRIVAHFPPHKIYVEPFGGAASILLRKPRSLAEVYNDLDEDVVNFFRVLRDPRLAQDLRRLVALTPFARAEFEAAYEPADDSVERARRLLVRSFQGFGSCASRADRTTGWRTGVRLDSASAARDWRGLPEGIAQLTDRLAGVSIERRPALDVLRAYDADGTMFYVDPPYVHETRSKKRTRCAPSNGYTYELTDGDHVELLDVLRALRGSVVLSGYAHPLYDAALAGWRRIELETHADGARPRTEVLWLNGAAMQAEGLFGALG